MATKKGSQLGVLINFQVLNAFSIFSLENVGDDISELLAESIIAMVQIRVIGARLSFSTAHASRNKREKTKIFYVLEVILKI